MRNLRGSRKLVFCEGECADLARARARARPAFTVNLSAARESKLVADDVSCHRVERTTARALNRRRDARSSILRVAHTRARAGAYRDVKMRLLFARSIVNRRFDYRYFSTMVAIVLDFQYVLRRCCICLMIDAYVYVTI